MQYVNIHFKNILWNIPFKKITKIKNSKTSALFLHMFKQVAIILKKLKYFHVCNWPIAKCG